MPCEKSGVPFAEALPHTPLEGAPIRESCVAKRLAEGRALGKLSTQWVGEICPIGSLQTRFAIVLLC